MDARYVCVFSCVKDWVEEPRGLYRALETYVEQWAQQKNIPLHTPVHYTKEY